MLLRISASVLALGTVLIIVFCEFYLSYMGWFVARDTLYSGTYDLLLNITSNDGFADSLTTVVVYTLPEGIALLMLYQLFMALGRAMGLGESTTSQPY